MTVINTKVANQAQNSRADAMWTLSFLAMFVYLTYLTAFQIDYDTNDYHSYKVSLIGFILIDIGWLILFIAAIMKQTDNPSRNIVTIKLFGAALLFIGGLCYFIAASYFLYHYYQTCDNSSDDSNNPCYYSFYYLSIIELIGAKSMVFGLFILCFAKSSLSLQIKTFLFACDLTVSGVFAINFFVSWNNDNNNGSTVDTTIYQCMLIGWLLIIVIALGIFVFVSVFVPRSGGVSTKTAVIGCIVALIAVFGGGLILGGAIDADVNGVFGDFKDNGVVFSIVRFGISAFLTMYGYAVMIIAACISVIKGNIGMTNDNNRDINADNGYNGSDSGNSGNTGGNGDDLTYWRIYETV